MATKLIGRKQITSEWLRQALNEEGYTLVDVSLEYHVTDEWIRRIAREWNINSSVKSRTPMWFAKRAGNPKLGEKKWMIHELRRTGDIKSLSQNLGLEYNWLKSQVKRLGITPFSWCKYKNGNCAFCGRPIKRLRSHLNEGQSNLFCNNNCYHNYRRGRPINRKKNNL